MSIRVRVSLVALWVFSLLAVGVLASRQTRVQPTTVVSGQDVGFRIDRWQGKTPVGTLVVKVDGEWVDAQFATKALLVH